MSETNSQMSEIEQTLRVEHALRSQDVWCRERRYANSVQNWTYSPGSVYVTYDPPNPSGFNCNPIPSTESPT